MPDWLDIRRFPGSAALLFCLVLPSLSFAQDVASARQAAIDAQAPVLIPELFSTAEKQYATAEQLAESKAPGAERAQKNASELYISATEEAGRRAARLRITLEARRLALVAGADTLAVKLWQEAENNLAEAVAGLDRNRDDIVQEATQSAQQAYDAAELEAIETSILGTAREQLKTATKLRAQRFAPRTLQRGRALAIEARELLERDRYATAQAGELSVQAEAHARRAIQISKLAGEKPALEDVILAWESRLQMLEETADQAKSDSMDPDQRVAALAGEIERLRRQETDLQVQLQDSQNFIAALEEEIRELDDRLGGASAERRDLIIKLETQARSREQLAQAKALFTSEEAHVFTQSEKIIVRLSGLQFASGSSAFDKESAALLQKLESLIAIYPDSALVIEGHTDSQGSEKNNQRLSQERADAILNLLVADMRVAPNRLTAIGYGETRPIANNETSSGRARNRRIDLIITPALKLAEPMPGGL